MKLSTNIISESYPKDEILSYKVTIVKEDSIKEEGGQYVYDAYLFSGIQEYNKWIMDSQKVLLEDKDKKIKELEQIIDSLKTSLVNNEDTINSILTEVIPSIMTEKDMI